MLFGSVLGQVYSVEKRLEFKIYYHQKKQNLRSHEMIDLLVTGKTWRQSKDQSEGIWRYNTDADTRRKFNNQFSIGWTQTDTTGFIDNEVKLWIHPPRHNQYTLTETSPFPDIRKKLNFGDQYTSVLFVGKGWGDLSGKKIKSTYTISKIKREKDETLWTINAVSEFEGKTNTAKFIYSSKEGFIFIHYTFYNGDEMKMKLIKNEASLK